MKYLSNWQPLLNEDRHTALVFGFMRHAPTAVALNPWLSGVLGRPVKAAPLGQGAFWPTLPSRVPGFADLQSRMTGSDQNQFRSWTASLRHCGFLVQVQGADRELVLQAARALRPIPAGAH